MTPQRPLTPKQDRFVKAMVQGVPDQMTAARIAGYEAKNNINLSKIASQLLDNPRIRSTIALEIASGDYDEKIRSVWTDSLSDPAIHDSDPSVRIKANALRLKAIDQIMKAGGLEAPKKIEQRTLKADLSYLLTQVKIAK